MIIKEFKKEIKKPLRKATLCFLVKDDKVLLAMKKRGFGKNRFNGVGGKQLEGETIRQTAIRETEEEIGVKILNPQKVGVLDFYFPQVPPKDNWNQQVIVYLVTDWSGKPTESDEMKPKWFNINKLPIDKMWSGDRFWLPYVLDNKKVQAEFAFDLDQKVIDYTLKVW